MDSETKQLETIVGDMRKRQEKMADGRRYILYYTFGKDSPVSESPNTFEDKNQEPDEVNENV